MTRSVPVLLLTGPVGVGKTTIAWEASALLESAGIAHAVIDFDQLRACYPAPEGDPFTIALGLRNLAVVWANFHAAGAERLILVDIVGENARRERYRPAVPGAAIILVRLRAPLPVLLERVRARERGAGLTWHEQRTAELHVIMERNAVGDMVVETDERSVEDVAREVLERCEWLLAPGNGDHSLVAPPA